MRLTVIGCSGSFAGPESAASCYLLEGEQDGHTWRVLLDLGSGALGTLQRYVDPVTVDAVLVSHLHPDHYFDLSGLYVMWKYHPGGPRPRIPVYGPRGVAEQCARAYGLRQDPGMSEEFEFHEYDGHPIRLGPFTVHARRLVHPITAYGLRVESGGHTVVYSGDTEWCEALVEAARDADLFVCEAYTFSRRVRYHLDHATLARNLDRIRARRVILTHLGPDMLTHRHEAVAECADDGLVVDV